MTLLEEIGVRFLYEPALQRFRAAGVPVEVTDVDCIDTSFPGFQPLLEGLTR